MLVNQTFTCIWSRPSSAGFSDSFVCDLVPTIVGDKSTSVCIYGTCGLRHSRTGKMQSPVMSLSADMVGSHVVVKPVNQILTYAPMAILLTFCLLS